MPFRVVGLGPEDQIGHLLRGAGLHSFDHVLVGVRGDEDVRVAEPFGHHPDVDASDQSESGPGMPEVVQVESWGAQRSWFGERRRSKVLENASGWYGLPSGRQKINPWSSKPDPTNSRSRSCFAFQVFKTATVWVSSSITRGFSPLVLGTMRPSRPLPLGFVSGMHS